MEGMCNYLSPVTMVRSLVQKHVFPAKDQITAATWREATIVLAIFIAAQVADGVLTYWGVTTLGIHVEGNGLLAAGMHAIGPFSALVSAKLMACLCGYILYRTASHRPLAVMAGLYIGVAVTPWLFVYSGIHF